MTSTEENKRIAQRFLELVSAHRIDDLCALVAPTWTMHGGPPNLPAGPDGIHALFGSIGPVEQTWTIEQIVAEGDTVVVRATNTYRQDSFFGIDDRGQWQVFTAMFMHRIADGQILETWCNADDLGGHKRITSASVLDAGA